MRRAGLYWGLAAVLAASAAQADDYFPYIGYIHSDDVYVRSGPGKNYYPTDKLAKGTQVEVYRHDPGGWCAIRPPEGSFSWVSSRYLKPLGDGLAMVTAEDVVSRVGSRFSTVRDVIQVRLERGEKVELIDQADAEGQTWYKIAPPSGEFRWVAGSFVDRQPPHDGVSQPRSQTQEAALIVPEETEDSVAEDAVRNADHEAEPEQAIVLTGGTDPRPPRSTVRLANRTPGAAAQGSQWSGRAAAARGGRIEPDYFTAELNRIDAEISTMVAEEPTVWRFRPLQGQLEALVEQAGTAVERGKARRVQHKIARLEDIRRRYEQVATTQAETDRLNSALVPDVVQTLGTTPAAPASALTGATQPVGAPLPGIAPGQFDGRGILKTVRSSRPGTPAYALVDGQGAVTSFVSPAPGVNLQPYVNHYVGLVGARGYLPELERPHVTAKRVAALADNSGTMLR